MTNIVKAMSLVLLGAGVSVSWSEQNAANPLKDALGFLAADSGDWTGQATGRGGFSFTEKTHVDSLVGDTVLEMRTASHARTPQGERIVAQLCGLYSFDAAENKIALYQVDSRGQRTLLSARLEGSSVLVFELEKSWNTPANYQKRNTITKVHDREFRLTVEETGPSGNLEKFFEIHFTKN